MKQKIEEFVYESLKEIITDDEVLKQIEANKGEFEIFSNIDSLDMVSFLVDVEVKVQEELGLTILITADRAMSARGPFSSVNSLVNFIITLIEEEK
tara:strand:- start:11666 stop:11953 length:288 start_codon:yes stop_codon:yes gene_type:complete